MVQPLTQRNVNRSTTSTHWWTQAGWRQTMPVDPNLTTPYVMDRSVTILKSPEEPTSCKTFLDDWKTYLSTSANQARMRAYEQLKGKISDRASLAVSLAEMHQSVNMIRNRSIQLFQFGRAILRRDIVGAARVLGVLGDPRLMKIREYAKAKPKQAADLYLEFHFGWSPLVSDIYSAVSVLQTPIKDVDIVARARQNSTWSHPGFGAWTQRWTRSAVTFVRYSCQVQVNNPNLWLANQLGLVNPAIVAIELVPFSFVADWFINLNQFATLSTDFLGLVVKNSQTTTYHVGLTRSSWLNVGWMHDAAHYHMTRSQGLALPSLGLRPWKLWGWRRMAAATSLLVQQLSRFH